MENLTSRRKIKISENDDNEFNEFIDIMESKLFIPKGIYRSITEKYYKNVESYVSSNKVLENELAKLRDNVIEILPQNHGLNLIEKVIEFEIRTIKSVEKVYNNLDSYGKVNKKLKMQTLFENTLDCNPRKRSFKSLHKQYNLNCPANKVSESAIQKTLTKKLSFSYKKYSSRPKSYFKPKNLMMQSLFFYRYCKDISSEIKYLFYDEFGISSCNKKEKLLFHKDENNISSQDKEFKRFNVKIICSFEKILAFEIENQSTESCSVSRFLIEFFESNQVYKSQDVGLIMDNATYHFDLKMLNYITKNTGRLLYIAPNTPEMNFIELVIGKIKSKIRERNNESE